MAVQCKLSRKWHQVSFSLFLLVPHLMRFKIIFICNFICRTVASAFIAADDDPCNDALEPIFGKKHR